MLNDLSRGAIDFDTDTFKCMLVTSSYTPSKSHSKRSDITNEVTGTGYTTGGNTATATVAAINNTSNLQDISWSITSWTSSTITARGAVVYKARGGASSADELVGYLDFVTDQSSSGGTFTVTVGTPLRLQN
jgi:hypothetical protein